MIAFSTMLLSSCDKEDGKALSPIFDKDVYAFQPEGVDTVLATKNDVKWFFDNLYIDNTPISFKEIKYYTKDVPDNADNDLGYIYKIENDWFSIENIGNKKVKIYLEKNENLKDREIKFNASVGNASTTVFILQGSVK